MINTTDLLPGNAFRTIAFDHSQVPQCLEASGTKTGTTFCDRSTGERGYCTKRMCYVVVTNTNHTHTGHHYITLHNEQRTTNKEQRNKQGILYQL